MAADAASFTCHVLPVDAFRVVSGANEGDPLGSVDDLCAGDVYRLDAEDTIKLTVADGGTGGGRVLDPGSSGHRIAIGSEIGSPGEPLTVCARLTFLAPEGQKVDLLLIALGDQFAALLLEPMEPACDHTLIGIDPAPGPVRLTDVSALAFAKGTRITLADGRQRPVEALSAGDFLLTRDHGPQPLRWVLSRTVRAVGAYSPVVIVAGTLGNLGDLALGQPQRLFVYQQGDDRLGDTAELLVPARYLLNSDSVFLRSGGFVDYFTLVLDRHEVLYAECIPVESLEVNAKTLPALPEEVSDALPNLDHQPHYGTDADEPMAEQARNKLLKPRSS